MSTYGATLLVNKGGPPLPTTHWTTKDKAAGSQISIDLYHLTLETVSKWIQDWWSTSILCPHKLSKKGRHIRWRKAFESYFFAANVIVGLLADKRNGTCGSVESQGGVDIVSRADSPFGSPGSLKGGQLPRWEDIIVGFYYIKPNYPGRSSHICNAGFVVPKNHRNKGYGRVLARSYLYYGPKLGYRGSVFNLVYVNNTASIRLWESLGFTKAGLIPDAGPLRKDGGGEEYVDALVFYKSFIGDGDQH